MCVFPVLPHGKTSIPCCHSFRNLHLLLKVLRYFCHVVWVRVFFLTSIHSVRMIEKTWGDSGPLFSSLLDVVSDLPSLWVWTASPSGRLIFTVNLTLHEYYYSVWCQHTGSSYDSVMFSGRKIIHLTTQQQVNYSHTDSLVWNTHKHLTGGAK